MAISRAVIRRVSEQDITNPKFNIMQKFNYTPSNPFSGSLSSLAFGVGMIIVPLVWPFGIRIGRMQILGPTAVTVIFVLGGLALLAFTVQGIMQARKLIAQGGEITVDDDQVTIPVVKKGAVVQESFRLSEVEYTKMDTEENEFKISLPTDHHVIRGAFFESDEAFEEFKSHFNK